MKKLLFISGFALSAMCFVACGGGEGSSHDSEQHAAAEYQCPMKCEGETTHAEPGKCSVCGMDLAVVEAE